MSVDVRDDAANVANVDGGGDAASGIAAPQAAGAVPNLEAFDADHTDREPDDGDDGDDGRRDELLGMYSDDSDGEGRQQDPSGLESDEHDDDEVDDDDDDDEDDGHDGEHDGAVVASVPDIDHAVLEGMMSPLESVPLPGIGDDLYVPRPEFTVEEVLAGE